MLEKSRLLILFVATFGLLGTACAEIPCYAIRSLGCWEIPDNAYVACGYTLCDNNACPDGTTEEGPTMETFDKTIPKSEFDPWYDEGPYETFRTNNHHVACHYSIGCDKCRLTQTANVCHTDISYINDPNNIWITYSMPKLIDIQGVETCFE